MKVKLTSEEKKWIGHIKAITGITMTRYMYAGNNKLCIPFIGSLEVTVKKEKDKVKETIKINPNDILKDSIVMIAEGKKTKIEKFLKNEISSLIKAYLDPDVVQKLFSEI
jgi:hypothetical protein